MVFVTTLMIYADNRVAILLKNRFYAEPLFKQDTVFAKKPLKKKK